MPDNYKEIIIIRIRKYLRYVRTNDPGTGGRTRSIGFLQVVFEPLQLRTKFRRIRAKKIDLISMHAEGGGTFEGSRSQ